MDNKHPQFYENASAPLTMKQIIVNNLVGGIAWGFGATIGLSIIIAMLTYVANYVNLVPVIGTFISDIINFILEKNTALHK